MMEDKTERVRNFNWEPEETAILEEMYVQYAEILDSKLRDNATNYKKNKVLNKIKESLKINVSKYNSRDIPDIKEKLKKLKRLKAEVRVRGPSYLEKDEIVRTDGGKHLKKPSKMHENRAESFKKNTPGFNGLESDFVSSPSATVLISSTPSPLFSETRSKSRKSPRFSQEISTKRKNFSPSLLPATKSRKNYVAVEGQVSKAKPSTSSIDSADYTNQLRVEVLELEKERLQLDIEKIRRKNELLEIKKIYLERKLEKL